MRVAGGRLDSNITYQCWSNLCATATQTDVSCASLGSADDLLVSTSTEDIPADVSELMDISVTDLQLPAAGDTAVHSEPVVSGQPLGQEIAPTTRTLLIAVLHLSNSKFLSNLLYTQHPV